MKKYLKANINNPSEDTFVQIDFGDGVFRKYTTQSFWYGILLDDDQELKNVKIKAPSSVLTDISVIESLEPEREIETEFDENCHIEGDFEVPPEVTTISADAFAGCDNLKSVTVPDSVEVVQEEAFKDCEKLESVKVSDNVLTNGDDKFQNLALPDNKDLPLTITVDGEGDTLSTSDSFKSNSFNVKISSKSTEIGSNRFKNATKIKSVTIPKSVTKMDASAFSGCNNLKDVYYKSDVKDWVNIDFESNVESSFITKTTVYKSNPCANNANLYFNGKLAINPEVPNGVGIIKQGAFYNCQSIEGITIPSSVTNVDLDVFKGCSNLKKLNYTGSIAGWLNISFASNPFINDNVSLYINNEELKNVIIPTDVTVIHAGVGNGDFGIPSYFCKLGGNIESIIFPDSLENIDAYAFTGCKKLMSVTIPDCVTSIGSFAFYYCTSLTSIRLPNHITSIESETFRNCTSLESVAIPDSVTSIGSSAFKDCTSLTDITIGNSVIRIENTAFSNCSSIRSVIIPDTVTSLGTSAFAGCTSLENITLGKSLNNIDASAFQNCKSLKTINIPDNVVSIGGSAFAGCINVSTVILSKNIKSIGQGAFKDCIFDSIDICGDVSVSSGDDTFPSGLKTVKIIESSKTVSNKIFKNLKNIETVVISEGVESIGNYAFYDCTNLTDLTIPSSLKSFGADPFGYCSSVLNVRYNGTINDWLNLTGLVGDNSGNYSFGWTNAKLLINNEEIHTITIPNNITTIRNNAFQSFKNIEGVIIHENVKSIGQAAFKSSGLVSVSLPNNVTEIKNSTFAFCKDLTDVTMSENVNNIGAYAFQGCTSLTSITIPDSVTSIGTYAFRDCTNLRTIKYKGTEAQWETISKSSGWNLNCPAEVVFNYEGNE